MNERNDNKLENKFFEIILNNRKINEEVLKIYDLINSQNIYNKDKEIINKTIFGFWLVNEDNEIKKLLKTIRNDNIKDYLLYKLVFEIVEDFLDISDKNHLNILLWNVKEDIETDLIYFIKDIFDIVYSKIKNELESKKSIFEKFSSDYLQDDELEDLLKEIKFIFDWLIYEVKNSSKKEIIQNKILKSLEKKNKLFNINNLFFKFSIKHPSSIKVSLLFIYIN